MIEPKISTGQDIAILIKAYNENKMSIVDIEKQSENLFGQYVSRGTIYKTLIRNNIPCRSKSVSVQRAMSTLNLDQSFLTEEIVEWIDGLMLGDGYMNFRKPSYQGSRIMIGTSSKQWAEYAMSRLTSYDPCEPDVYQKIDEKHPNTIWDCRTKTHPDLTNQAKRWYCGKNESKIIPEDVRITPKSVMLWYLGDGSFTKHGGNSSNLKLATCSFSKEDIEEKLLSKMEKHGIDGYVGKYKNNTFIRSHSIRNFFNFIGWQSPFSDYSHKFDIPDWLKLYRLQDITVNQKEKWRIQKWCKSGKVESSKSPGGKIILFTKEQVDQVKNVL